MKRGYKILTVLVMIPVILIGTTWNVQAEEYEYDDLNRVMKVTYENGSYVEYEYDGNGNILSVQVHDGAADTKQDKEPDSGETEKPDSGNQEDTDEKENPSETEEKSGIKDFIEKGITSLIDETQEMVEWIRSIGLPETENPDIDMDFIENSIQAIQNIFRRISQGLRSLFQ